MSKVFAMITPNFFTLGGSNGWQSIGDVRIFFYQRQPPDFWGDSRKDLLWDELRKAASTIDKIIFYVGTSQSIVRAIEICKEYNIPADRVILLTCNANKSTKREVIEEMLFSAARVLYVDYGGSAAMMRLYQGILQGFRPQ